MMMTSVKCLVAFIVLNVIFAVNVTCLDIAGLYSFGPAAGDLALITAANPVAKIDTEGSYHFYGKDYKDIWVS